jgi:hypothetical protein
MQVNLEADVDTKTNYEREIELKIEADEEHRRLESMLRIDPHKYERLRARSGLRLVVRREEGRS